MLVFLKPGLILRRLHTLTVYYRKLYY